MNLGCILIGMLGGSGIAALLIAIILLLTNKERS